MNNIFRFVLCGALAFSSMQSSRGFVIPATNGISKSPDNGTNNSETPSAEGNRKSIFYFNLTELSGGAAYTQSTLRLFLPRLPKSGSIVSIYKIRGTWNGQTSVFQPQIDATPLITVPAEQIETTRILDIDVSALVKDWSTSPTCIEGFLVSGMFGESSPNIVSLNFDGATSFGLSASLVVDEQASSQSGETDPFDQWPASLKSRLINPVFSVQPRVLSTGSIAAIAHGAGNISYQWLNNGVPVPNATSPSLSLDGLAGGNYTLRATNGFSSVTSAPIRFDAANYIPNFSLIPAGTFQMGDNLDGNADAPVHNVYVSQFFMAQTEVTCEQWIAVKLWADEHNYSFDTIGSNGGSDHPVTHVSWYDAVKWCNARSEMEGLAPCYYTDANKRPSFIYQNGQTDISNSMVDWHANGYRLPTEAEWEKAARGGLAGKRFPSGAALDDATANFNSAVGADTSSRLYPNNGYGLFGMAGNAWEYCWDRSAPYSLDNLTDPQGSGLGSGRICRGGGWHDSPEYCSVFKRNGGAPNVSYTMGGGGFRLSRTVKVMSPKITTQPLLYPSGNLIVSAQGTDISYQWYKNGTPIAGGTSASIPVSSGSLSSGTYTVKVSNSIGSVTSGSLQLSPATNPNFHDVVPVAGTNVAFSRYETTVGQWKTFVAETGWNKGDEWKAPDSTWGVLSQTDVEPVVEMSFQDSIDYCQWLSLKTGKIWRLPTSEEWSTAIGSSTYPWGESFPPTPQDGNYFGSLGETHSTTKVGSYPARAFGIYDMGGNAWEWVSDPEMQGILRGASYYDFQIGFLRSSSVNSTNIRTPAVGFRVVRELPPDITSGLVAYYPFNGNAKDATGHGFDGTIVGAISSTDRFSNQGGYTFPSAGNKIKLPMDNSKFESEFTFSIWIKADAFDNFYPQIVCGQNSYLILHGNGPIYPAESVNKIGFYQYIQNSDSYYGNIETINTIPTGAWIQVVITGDETKRSIYINGKLNQSVAISPTIQKSQGENIALGGHSSIDEEQFRWQGTLDDVRIYNRALTAKDVDALYDSEK